MKRTPLAVAVTWMCAAAAGVSLLTIASIASPVVTALAVLAVVLASAAATEVW